MKYPSILLAVLLCAGCDNAQQQESDSREALVDYYVAATERMAVRLNERIHRLDAKIQQATNRPEQQPRWMFPAPMPSTWPTNISFPTNFYVTDPVNVEAQ